MPHTTGLIGTYRHFWQDPPDETSPQEGTVWYHRTQNMVNVYMSGPAGSSFAREDNPDEAFVWVLFNPVRVSVRNGPMQDVGPGSLVILPPGESVVELPEGGSVWLGFTALATDLLERCPNNEEYAAPLPHVAPITPWPEPKGGYKLRVYDLDNRGTSMPPCYRHRTALTRFAWPVPTKPRDHTAFSPHSHADFEQSSLIHSGTHVHHVRRPWSRNSSEWLPDEHIVLSAPSIAITKPPDIHTTQAVSTSGPVGLIDFFAPVRWDFSIVDGMVLNADEYPMPDKEPEFTPSEVPGHAEGGARPKSYVR